MARLCPVCHINKIVRYDMRTCSVMCSKTWKTWSPEHQAEMIRQAEKPVDLMALVKKAKLDPNYVDPELEKEDKDLPGDASIPESLRELIGHSDKDDSSK
jgi:hypothetical protein